MENRGEVVDTQIKELNNGLTTTKRAVEKINPELDEDEINDLMSDIDNEATERMESMLENPGEEDEQQKQEEVGNEE